MVKKHFPQVRLIENKANTGFSVANNQAIRLSTGRYVLLLNPDTVVGKDTFSACLAFMDKHPEAGGLGVRMIDGSGRFLPESKRGLPTPWVSFCKAFGLSGLFPNSKKFGQYYLSYLSENEVHEVDVLSGAFMLMRKEALDKIGLLDESFFMYGEDVDLSYRILEGGYKNYYFPFSTIIHFKGESTRRESFAFVKHFYKAMLLFSKKHFSQNPLFTLVLYLGILVRGFLAVSRRFLDFVGAFCLEFGAAYAGMIIIKDWWEINFKGVPGMYPPFFIQVVVPLYLFVWLGATRLVGQYSEKYGQTTILKGILWGTIIISGVTNFFDAYRFSKGLILIGAIWTYVVAGLRLKLWDLLSQKKAAQTFGLRMRWAVVGTKSNFDRVQQMVSPYESKILLAGWIAPHAQVGDEQDAYYLGNVSELAEISYRLGLDQIVFALEGMPAQEAIQIMDRFSGKMLNFSFLAQSADFLVSSSQKHDRGHILLADFGPAILLPYNLRLKRLADLLLCGLLLLLWPLSLHQGFSFSTFFQNWWQVLTGQKTWLSLSDNHLLEFGLRNGILTMADLAGAQSRNSWVRSLDILYIQEFQPALDVWNVLKNMGKIGLRKT